MADSITFKTGNILIGFKNAVSKKKNTAIRRADDPETAFTAETLFCHR
jgi:hypothetical protein